MPRTHPEMIHLSRREIGNFEPETRLAASEAPKIAQIGSLARMKKVFALGPPLAPRFFHSCQRSWEEEVIFSNRQ